MSRLNNNHQSLAIWHQRGLSNAAELNTAVNGEPSEPVCTSCLWASMTERSLSFLGSDPLSGSASMSATFIPPPSFGSVLARRWKARSFRRGPPLGNVTPAVVRDVMASFTTLMKAAQWVGASPALHSSSLHIHRPLAPLCSTHSPSHDLFGRIPSGLSDNGEEAFSNPRHSAEVQSMLQHAVCASSFNWKATSVQLQLVS